MDSLVAPSEFTNPPFCTHGPTFHCTDVFRHGHPRALASSSECGNARQATNEGGKDSILSRPGIQRLNEEGRFGTGGQAAIMREGLKEMRVLAERIYPTVRDLTFFESCGVADLIATCYGGRNRMVAEAYCRNYYQGTVKSFEELEVRLRYSTSPPSHL